MEKTSRIVVALLLLFATASFAQTGKLRQVLDRSVNDVEKPLVAAAEAMPADKYSFVPTNGEFRGVRSFAKQLKHVAAANYLFAAGILGENPPADAADERGPDSVRSKAEITKYLKDSFEYLHKAMAAIDERNMVEPIAAGSGRTRLGLFAGALSHSSNHYGQIVEYLRMNGVIPSASQ